MLRSGIPWKLPPREMGCGSGTTCSRRLARWQRAGVRRRVQTVLPAYLRRRGELDLARAVADSASQRHRDALHERRIATQLAKRRTPHGSGPGPTRWVVERTSAWLHRLRRLAVRYERRPCIHEAFLTLACSPVGWYYLKPLI